MYNIGEETEQIEFKKSTGELKEGVISVASILNKHGSGELYFGVKNNGDVIGQDISDTTLRDISRSISEHIRPMIYPLVEKRNYGDKTVAYVKFEGNRAPYLAYNVPRIRVADEDKTMDQNTYHDMLSERDASKPWELQVSKYTVKDIIEKDFKLYLRRAKEAGRITFDSEEYAVVLDKLELLAEDGVHLLNAGAVLFCDSSMNDVQMAKFATDVKATFTDIRREDRGSIIGLARVCEQYIIDAMDWKADIIGLKRVETPEIPVEAVREAIINSYGHRLYNNYQCNEIDVFKNRIEIHTTGGFPKGHTPEEFLDGNKKAIRRNKLITGILYYSDDMETFATGLKRIKDLCDDAGCKVEFRTETDDFVVAFYRNLREEWNKVDDNSLDSTTKKLPRNYQETTKTKKEMIKDIMRDNPLASAAMIAEQVGLSESGVQYHIKKMKATGEIERLGSDKGGRWKVNN
ncbi:MAG: putative DNA binding domain-containing protein [Lachnospiraceae bacterium]|nr:putative DNA binding domain-containing protein [Lachnospiraceae bacterium]